MRRQYPFAEDVQNYVDRSLVLTHAFVPVIEVQLFCVSVDTIARASWAAAAQSTYPADAN